MSTEPIIVADEPVHPSEELARKTPVKELMASLIYDAGISSGGMRAKHKAPWRKLRGPHFMKIGRDVIGKCGKMPSTFVENLLRNGIADKAEWELGWPNRVWALWKGVVFEAHHSGRGYFHGYPLCMSDRRQFLPPAEVLEALEKRAQVQCCVDLLKEWRKLRPGVSWPYDLEMT